MTYPHDNEWDEERSAEDYEFGDVAATKSADQIENENSFKQIPPGDHMLVVKGFAGPPKVEPVKVFLDGQVTSYEAAIVGVDFHIAHDNSGATIRDYFTLPPNDPAEQRAYFEGKTKPDDSKEKPGFAASKFLHFIARLGFEYPPGGHLPPAARKLGNWKNRAIHATVDAGKPYPDKKTGEMKPGYNRIKLFSYRAVGAGGTGNRNGGISASASQSKPASSAASSAYSAPARSAAVGLNDL